MMGEDKGMTIKVFRNVRMNEEGVQTKRERKKRKGRNGTCVKREGKSIQTIIYQHVYK